jgi:hypothetical protein
MSLPARRVSYTAASRALGAPACARACALLLGRVAERLALLAQKLVEARVVVKGRLRKVVCAHKRVSAVARANPPSADHTQHCVAVKRVLFDPLEVAPLRPELRLLAALHFLQTTRTGE